MTERQAQILCGVLLALFGALIVYVCTGAWLK